MLKEFNVRNFLSINEKVSLSMETGAYLKKYTDTNTMNILNNRILKNAVIFGANGSGKTNIVEAIKTMRNMVLYDTNTVTATLPYRPFSFVENRSLDSSFEIKFIYDDIEYQYAFTYNKTSILKESLYYTEHNRLNLVFDYDKEKEIFDFYGNLNIDFSKIRENQLHLFILQNTNEKHASNVYRWFEQSLIIEDFKELSLRFTSDLVANMGEKGNKDRLLEYLKYADTNIIDVEVVRDKRNIPFNVKQMKNIMMIMDDSYSGEFYGNVEKFEDIYTLHTIYHTFDSQGRIVGKSKLSLNAESAGTIKLIEIALVLLNLGNRHKTIIIDELDNSLHYKIITALVKLFNSTQNKNQLIFTTHNVMIIDEDLRTDQIYFVEKNYKGETELYSLFDFNESSNLPRGDIKYLRRYISGQFGALPNVDADKMLYILKEKD